MGLFFRSFSPQQTLVEKPNSNIRRRGGGKGESVWCFLSAAEHCDSAAQFLREAAKSLRKLAANTSEWPKRSRNEPGSSKVRFTNVGGKGIRATSSAENLSAGANHRSVCPFGEDVDPFLEASMAHLLQQECEEPTTTLRPSRKIDVLYLFGCFVSWRKDRASKWYQELLSATDDADEEVSMVAKWFWQECQRLAPSDPNASSRRGTLCRS